MSIKSVNLTGDWHIQNESDAKRIDKLLPKTVPLVLMGDLIDVGIDRGMQWNQESVNMQVIYLQELLAKRRVLGYTLGNHEQRIVTKTGLNPYQTFLGDPQSLYWFKLSAKIHGISKVVQLAIKHGTRVVKNPLSQLKTLGLIHKDADMVALGHDHTLGFFRVGDQWHIRTGHLQPYPEYAQEAILEPRPMGYIRYSLKTGKPEVILV